MKQVITKVVKMNPDIADSVLERSRRGKSQPIGLLYWEILAFHACRHLVAWLTVTLHPSHIDEGKYSVYGLGMIMKLG